MTDTNSILYKIGQAVKAAGDSGGGPTLTDDYSEPTFTDGILTAMTTYTSSSKSTLVSSKAFTYTNGALTQVVESDENGATHLTKTITYDSSGNLESVTKDYA